MASKYLRDNLQKSLIGFNTTHCQINGYFVKIYWFSVTSSFLLQMCLHVDSRAILGGWSTLGSDVKHYLIGEGVYTTLLITHPLYPIQKMLRCIFLKGQAGLYQYCNNDIIQSNIHQITEYTSGSTKADSILLFFLLLFKFCQAQRSWLVLISVYYHPPTHQPTTQNSFKSPTLTY